MKKHTTAKKATGMIAVARDVTELKRAEEERARSAADRARAEEMEKRIQKMRLIYEGSRKIALTLELDKIYNLALELACTALEADGGSVMILDDKTGELVVKVASGSQKGTAVGKRLKLGERFAGHAAQMKRALFMHDVEDEPWFKSLKKFEEIKSGMSIPLLVKDKLVGVLNLKRTQREEKFAKGDLGLVSILADYVASIIERNRVEEELRESEERLSVFMDSAPNAFALFDSELNLVEINRVGLEMFPAGTKKEDTIGKNITELYPAKKEEGRYDKYQEVMKTGKPLFVEDVVPHPKFGDVHLAVSAFKVGDGIGIIVTNITERKRAEEALRKSESSLAEAQRIAHMGNWDWDIVKNELRWSDEIYRIFGLKPREFGATYEAFLNSVHPDDREFVKKSVDEALYQRKQYSIDHRIVFPDGSERIVHEQAEVFLDKTGRPIRMVGTVQDITERKRAEEQTKQLREYLQLQVNRMPIGLIVWDKEFRARTWNPAATKIFGFTEKEALGKHPYDLIVPKEVQHKVDDVWRRLLEGDLTAYSVNENITKDGRTIICDWANTPLKEAGGTVMGVLSMVQDITERERSEKELKVRVKELEEFHELTVGRELKMKQMETELVRLRAKLGEKLL